MDRRYMLVEGLRRLVTDADMIMVFVETDVHDRLQVVVVMGGQSQRQMPHCATQVNLYTRMNQKSMRTMTRHHHHIHSDRALIDGSNRLGKHLRQLVLKTAKDLV